MRGLVGTSGLWAWQSPESGTSTHVLRLAEGIAPEEHGKKIKRLLELFLFSILGF